jgi:hypothetical protein
MLLDFRIKEDAILMNSEFIPKELGSLTLSSGISLVHRTHFHHFKLHTLSVLIHIFVKIFNFDPPSYGPTIISKQL